MEAANFRKYQRDINIAFMNEISIIFNKLNVDTSDIAHEMEFLRFQPGLVGVIVCGSILFGSYRHKNEKPLLIKAEKLTIPA